MRTRKKYVPVCMPVAAATSKLASSTNIQPGIQTTRRTANQPTRSPKNAPPVSGTIPTIIQNYYYGVGHQASLSPSSLTTPYQPPPPAPVHAPVGCRSLLRDEPQKVVIQLLDSIPTASTVRESRKRDHMHMFVQYAFEELQTKQFASGYAVISQYDEVASRLFNGLFKNDTVAKYIVMYMLLVAKA